MNGNVQVVMVLCLLISSVKCRFGCNALKSVRMDCMSEWLGSKIRKMSIHKQAGVLKSTS